MNRKECLPIFFAIKDESQYKVFYRQIYQSFKSLGFPANIVWPVEDITLGHLSKSPLSPKKNNTFIKRWNSTWYKSCSWIFSGHSVEMWLDRELHVIPILDINCDEGTLPFNNSLHTPSD